MSYLAIIASLFIIEVLLSVDNALVNATLAESLPQEKRTRAIRLGILLGAVFRIIALLTVSIIIENPWLKVAGGLYLVYLMMDHVGKVTDDEGKSYVAKPTFRGVVTQIAIADIVFSIDNVISAVSFSDNTAIVMLGVGIGVVSMLFITPILSRLIDRYKGMPVAAYVIVGFIGFTLLLETLLHVHSTELEKFGVIIAIVFFTVWYEHSRAVRTYTIPVLSGLRYVVALPLDIVYTLKSTVVAIAKGK
jgi:YkoY family integral membrane protein